MTRINIIPPVQLLDQHLVAEYRETRLLTALLRRSMGVHGESKKNIPAEFTLNTGHVSFFRDKGKYVANRYEELKVEMEKRGMVPQEPTLDLSCFPEGFNNDWTPTPKDQSIVRERILERVMDKPTWYRYYGIPLKSTEQYQLLITNLTK